jgi:Domain of unknown function (DUF4268)
LAEQLLFTVAGSVAMPAHMVSLEEAGFAARADVQEWVRSNPEILGLGVEIVTFDFDRAGTIPEQPDRMSVLGLGQDGRLVVAELKWGKGADAEVAAVKYAAWASRMLPESLADHYARHHTINQYTLTVEEALAELQAHAPDLSQETLRKPRIVLLARDFSPVLTSSVVWLSEMGLDISLFQINAYLSSASPLAGTGPVRMISVSQLYPLRDVEEFTISPERQLARELADSKKRVQDATTVRRLVTTELIAEGTIFTLSPRLDISFDMRTRLEEWLHADPARRTAHWQNRANAPLVWDADKSAYSPSALVRHIVEQATGVSRDFPGAQWWRDPAGWTLFELAGPLSGGKGALYREFWSRWLDRVRVEHGDWTQMSTLPAQNFITMPSPVKGTHYGLIFAAGDRLRSHFTIELASGEASTTQFEILQAEADMIESIYGGELSWERLPDRVAYRIADYTDGEVSRVEEHDYYIDWMISSQERLRQAINAALGAQPSDDDWTRR